MHLFLVTQFTSEWLSCIFKGFLLCLQSPAECFEINIIFHLENILWCFLLFCMISFLMMLNINVTPIYDVCILTLMSAQYWCWMWLVKISSCCLLSSNRAQNRADIWILQNQRLLLSCFLPLLWWLQGRMGWTQLVLNSVGLYWWFI